MSDSKRYRVKCEHCTRVTTATRNTETHAASCDTCGKEITFISSVRDCPHDPVHMWSERGKCITQTAKERAAKSTRKREVFPTDEIPHLWAHKVQDNARNPGGNLYFSNETIYSYGSHFPIARHITRGTPSKQTAILFTTATYSVTTSKHLGMVRSAIPERVQVFNVPVLADSWLDEKRGRTIDHTKNLAHYIREVADYIGQAARARDSRNKEWKHARAIDTRNEYLAYLKFFKLGKSKIAPIPALDSKQMEALRARESAKAAEQAANTKRERAEAYAEQERICTHEPKHSYADRYTCQQLRQSEQEAREFESKRDAWKRGEVDHLPGAYSRGPLLRIVGDEVQTSRGVRFPVEHAKRGLALVRAVIARGEEWRTNGHSCHLGHYRIDSIEANGTVHAGCHVVPYSEVESIAPQLDAYTAVESPSEVS